jgi:hypothetical protein
MTGVSTPPQIKTDFELYGRWKGFGMVHNIHMGYGSDLPARITNFAKVILSSVYQIQHTAKHFNKLLSGKFMISNTSWKPMKPMKARYVMESTVIKSNTALTHSSN